MNSAWAIELYLCLVTTLVLRRSLVFVILLALVLELALRYLPRLATSKQSQYKASALTSTIIYRENPHCVKHILTGTGLQTITFVITETAGAMRIEFAFLLYCPAFANCK